MKHWRENSRNQRSRWTPKQRKEAALKEVERQKGLKEQGIKRKKAPYVALTDASISALMRRVAERHGYTAHRGPLAGQGNPVELAIALGTGELATILLSDEQRSMAIRWLDEQAKTIENPSLAAAIQSIADQLYDAVSLEAETEEEEIRSYLDRP